MDLVGKPEGKRPIGRLMCRWKGNIKLGIQEMEWGGRTQFIWLRIEKSGGLLLTW